MKHRNRIDSGSKSGISVQHWVRFRCRYPPLLLVPTLPPFVQLPVDDVLRHVRARLRAEPQGQRLELVLRQRLSSSTNGKSNQSAQGSEQYGYLVPRISSPEKEQKKQIMAHSYRKAFFAWFPKFGNNLRYVSIDGGVLSLFVMFSRRKKTKFVKFHAFGKKKEGKNERLKNCTKQMSNLWGKKNSPIRLALSTSHPSVTSNCITADAFILHYLLVIK